MAWCPKCRNEYIEGITICKDCNELLVDSLEDYENVIKESLEQTQEEIDEDFDEETDDDEEKDSLSKPSPIYVKKEDKYKDMLSSAYTLLIVGFGGLLFLLLVVTDIINLHLASPGKYITYIGMAILLVFFVIIGFSSFHSSKKLAKEAESENQLTNDILDWFSKNVTADLIENEVIDDMSDEEQYFKKIENIKEIISKAYGELKEDYLDRLSEDIYQDKF